MPNPPTGTPPAPPNTPAPSGSGSTPSNRPTAPPNTTENPKNSLDKEKSLMYPYGKDLKSEDYLRIEILEYIAPGLSASSSNVTSFDIPESSNRFVKIKAVKDISLPIPSGINESNTVGWAAGSMNALVAKALAGSPINDPETQNILQDALGRVGGLAASIYDAGKQTSNSNRNTAAIALAVSTITGQSEIQQGLARNSGTIFNQNLELLFNNVNLRAPFNFNFTFSPRNEIESLHVKAIIRAFKRYMAPQRKAKNNANGLLISAPHVFRLQYMHGNREHPFLHKFKTCALTNMNVNYTGSNVYSTYPDGTPVHLEVTLTFQELSPIYFEDYNDTPEGSLGY